MGPSFMDSPAAVHTACSRGRSIPMAAGFRLQTVAHESGLQPHHAGVSLHAGKFEHPCLRSSRAV